MLLLDPICLGHQCIHQYVTQTRARNDLGSQDETATETLPGISVASQRLTHLSARVASRRHPGDQGMPTTHIVRLLRRLISS